MVISLHKTASKLSSQHCVARKLGRLFLHGVKNIHALFTEGVIIWANRQRLCVSVCSRPRDGHHTENEMGVTEVRRFAPHEEDAVTWGVQENIQGPTLDRCRRTARLTPVSSDTTGRKRTPTSNRCLKKSVPLRNRSPPPPQQIQDRIWKRKFKNPKNRKEKIKKSH